MMAWDVFMGLSACFDCFVREGRGDELVVRFIFYGCGVLNDGVALWVID